MGTPTSNHGFTKFGNAEPYDFDTMNSNFNKMDSAASKGKLKLPFDASLRRTNTTSVMTWAAGWAETSDRGGVRRFGPYCYVRILFKRTGSSISVPVSGNVANQTVGTLHSDFHPLQEVPLYHLATGRMIQGFIAANGDVRIANMNPGSGTSVPFDTNEESDLAAWYVLKTAVG